MKDPRTSSPSSQDLAEQGSGNVVLNANDILELSSPKPTTRDADEDEDEGEEPSQEAANDKSSIIPANKKAISKADLTTTRTDPTSSSFPKQPQQETLLTSVYHTKLNGKEQDGDHRNSMSNNDSTTEEAAQDDGAFIVPALTVLERTTENRRTQAVVQPGAVRIRPGGGLVVDEDEDDEEEFNSQPSDSRDMEESAAAPVNAVARYELQREAAQQVQARTAEAVVLSDQEVQDSIKLERYERKMVRIKQVCCVGMLLIAIIVGTVVGILLGGGDGSNGDDDSKDDNGDFAPSTGLSFDNSTEAPTSTPKVSLYEYIQSQLTGLAISALSSNPSSAEAQSYAALVDALLSMNENGNSTSSPDEIILYAPEDQASEFFIIHFFFLGIFYFDSGGPIDWRRKDGWMTDVPICTWYGVECNNNGTIVEAIRLPNNNMSGLLPGHNIVFEQLRVIDLQHNGFANQEGPNPLPSSWGKFENLQELYLGNNNLAAPYPFVWREDFDNVRILNLEENEITLIGRLVVPAALDKNYEEVRVRGNPMSMDMLNSHWSPKLRVLDISDGGSVTETVIIPDDFGTALPWTHIQEIYMHNNPSVSGLISTELCDMAMANDGIIQVDCERVACDCCVCA